jgi:predicted phage terminase large subunit-like protein
LTLEENQALLSMARRTLIDYCIVMQPDYDPSWHHEVIAQKLEKVEKGEITRLMLFMPPRHGKSELATKKFPAWYLGKNPNKEIICCSYSADLAEEFGRMTRDAVADELHQTIFPDCFLRKGSKSASKWKVGRYKGGFLAAGVGGSITGMGANVLLIDDPIKNREEANSDVYRQKVWDWYTSTAFTRLEKDGAVILIMTRWHDDDLAGRLLERDGRLGYGRDPETGMWKKGYPGKQGRWDVVTLPAIAEEDERFRRQGEALWPEKYDVDSLEEIKNTIGLQDFSALYQQNPVNKEAQLFQDEWFKCWKELPKHMNYVTAVDPAISKEKRADDSVVLTLGRDPNDKYYLVDIKNFKADPSELITEIFRQQEKWNSRVGVEVTQYQMSLVHYMGLEQQRMHKRLNIIPVRHSHKKEERIRGLEPFYRNGLIFHPPGGSEALEDQLKRFPSGKHDDMVDALATAIYLAQRPNVQMGGSVMKQTGIQYTKDGRPFITNK